MSEDPQPRSIYQYATADFLARFTPADSPTWKYEERLQCLLYLNHLDRIAHEMATKPSWPVAVCLRQNRVIDGHRRVIVTQRLGLPQILAVDARTDTVWRQYTDWPDVTT